MECQPEAVSEGRRPDPLSECREIADGLLPWRESGPMELPWRRLTRLWSPPAPSGGGGDATAEPLTHGDDPLATPEARPQFFVVVARSRPDLLDVCRSHLGSSGRAQLVVDRRARERRQGDQPPSRERRRADRRTRMGSDVDLQLRSVIVVPVGRQEPGGEEPAASGAEGSEAMLTEVVVGDDRERLEQWAEEGRKVLGSALPGLLDAGEHARARLVDMERDCQILREVNRRLVSRVKELEEQVERDRAERLEILETVNRSMAELTRPFNDILQKLGA